MYRIILIFICLGPSLGSFIFVSTQALTAAEFKDLSITGVLDSLHLGIVSILFFSVLGLPLAIPTGIIPAGICGFNYWLFLKKLTQSSPPILQRFFQGSLVSFVTTFFCCLLLYLLLPKSKSDSFFDLWVFIGWPGTIAGGICAMLVTNKIYYKIFPETPQTN